MAAALKPVTNVHTAKNLKMSAGIGDTQSVTLIATTPTGAVLQRTFRKHAA
jgi:hypothetical protein